MPDRASGRCKYGIAERVAHRLPGGFARLSNRARDVVGVDDRETSNGEVFGRRRLTRPDAARDDNSLHACTLATTCHTQFRRRPFTRG
jgi:hypothetical protein